MLLLTLTSSAQASIKSRNPLCAPASNGLALFLLVLLLPEQLSFISAASAESTERSKKQQYTQDSLPSRNLIQENSSAQKLAGAEAGHQQQQQRRAERAIQLVGPQAGIVVPKRSALISGLNKQFNLLHKNTNTNTNSSNSANLQQQQQQQNTAPVQSSSGASGSTEGSNGASSSSGGAGGGLFQSIKNPAASLLLEPLTSNRHLQWLGARVSAASVGVDKPLKGAVGVAASGGTFQQQQQALYLDRHQQQLLAANPNLLNPPTSGSVGQQQQQQQNSALLTRSELVIEQHLQAGVGGSSIQATNKSSYLANHHTNNNHNHNHHAHAQQFSQLKQGPLSPSAASQMNAQNYQQQNGVGAGHQLDLSAAAQNSANAAASSLSGGAQQQQPQPSASSTGGQLYRGYSLIELEVRNENDRRYIQDLYGNMSSIINEQANNANGGGGNQAAALSVSPYVDVDFWSFKLNEALNDQIDILVSPKARPFMLNQLARAKIRHRIKVDDMQSRLDQQQQAPGQITSAASTYPSASSHAQQREESLLSGRGGSAAGTPTYLSGTSNHGLLDAKPVHPSMSGSDPATSLNGRQQQAGEQQVSRAPLNDSLFFDNYQRLGDINAYVESMVEKNRDIARVQVIGRSSQGRYLRVVKLGYEPNHSFARGGGAGGDEEFSAPRPPPGNAGVARQKLNNASTILEQFFKKQESTKKLGSIWLDGGTHAREWISPATVMYIAHRLANNHQKCSQFYDQLRSAVAVNEIENAAAAAVELSELSAGSVSATAERTGRHINQVALGAPPSVSSLRAPPMATHLEADLLSGINEINSSLLGKPAKPIRARTELEQTLEQLAKQPLEVAQQFQCDLQLEQLLRRYTFYLMPVLNPDGYEYSHTHNRLWRKTRSTSSHPIYRHFCLGADPNRNYDARHGSTGSSTHPCSQTYAGTVPFTEPETRHQSNFVYANRADLKMYISFHSYSQMILLPYSHSKQLAPDHKDMESVGLAAVKAIEQTHGTVYKVGPSASILYTAAGTASDWAYEKAGIKYSYTIELRDTGSYGFLLPRQQIVPTGEETFNGLLAMIKQMEKNDNLLTSKSSLLVAPPGGGGQVVNGKSTNASATMTAAATGTGDDQSSATQAQDSLDLLKPISKQGIRLGLENVHEGSSSWNSLDAGQSGVRDRRPAPSNTGGHIGSLELPDEKDNTLNHINQQPKEGATAGSRYESLSGEPLIGHKPNPVNLDRRRPDPYNEHQHYPHDHMFASDNNNNNLLDEPTNIDDSAPDAGYAFEGEGELMEPTRENIVEAAKLNAEMRSLSGRDDHSRRISQAVGLTSSGRNFINSPQMKSRLEDYMAQPKRESSNNFASDRVGM